MIVVSRLRRKNLFLARAMNLVYGVTFTRHGGAVLHEVRHSSPARRRLLYQVRRADR